MKVGIVNNIQSPVYQIFLTVDTQYYFLEIIDGRRVLEKTNFTLDENLQ
jgi:hypothetical protein